MNQRNFYQSARYTLLIIVAFTVINCALWFTEAQTYFLFSAAIPYYLVIVGDVLAAEFSMPVLLVGAIGIAAVITAIYALLFILTKKHKWAMVAALVVEVIDTVLMLLLFDLGAIIIDIIIHAYILFELAMALRSGPEPDVNEMVIEGVPVGEPTEEPTPDTFGENNDF